MVILSCGESSWSHRGSFWSHGGSWWSLVLKPWRLILKLWDFILQPMKITQEKGGSSCSPQISYGIMEVYDEIMGPILQPEDST